MKIPEYVEFTLNRLEENGYTAYLVGGCVRDYLMGIDPHDFDITTSALPWQIEECFFDIKTLDIGKKHGTISLVFDGATVEVTTYRVDGEYKDMRHPESVTFTDKIENDLSRRDFTMNAIAYSPRHEFVDPYGGRADIERKIIACVGNPETRFSEDALRILRALRFSSRLGFDIDDDTKKAIVSERRLLLNIAYERINTEFLGILDGNHAAKVILEFIEVFRTIIPSLGSVDYGSIGNAKDFGIITKLCLFFSHFDNKNELSSLMKMLKFDNNTIKTVTSVVSLFNTYFSRHSDSDIKRAVSKIGVENTRILLEALYCHTNDKTFVGAGLKLTEFVNEGACMSLSALNVRGNEIIEKYHVNPSMTGRILLSLLDDVIDGKIPNDRQTLLIRAKQYIQ